MHRSVFPNVKFPLETLQTTKRFNFTTGRSTGTSIEQGLHKGRTTNPRCDSVPRLMMGSCPQDNFWGEGVSITLLVSWMVVFRPVHESPVRVERSTPGTREFTPKPAVSLYNLLEVHEWWRRGYRHQGRRLESRKQTVRLDLKANTRVSCWSWLGPHGTLVAQAAGDWS